MTQVVTNENMLELIQTGRVAEFVAPVTEPAKAEEPAKADAKDEQKSGEEAPAKVEAAAEAPKPKDVDEALPEKVQKRINEKHRQMKEAEEWGKAQYLEKLAAEKRVGELEAQLAKSTTPAPVEEPAKAPKQEDYSTVAEYVDAQVEWKLKQKEAESAEQARKSEQAQVEAAHQKRILEASSRIADYEEVVNRSDLELRMPLIQYIRESEMGPDLAYHLAKNKDVAERLNRLSPIKALAEMGKLELTLTKPAAQAEEPKAETPSKTPEKSKAPAPITPIDGKKEPVHKDPSEMSFAELRAHNEAQRRLKAQKR